ncbi:MAG: hypothetical protein NC912_05225 [Candidatus Omnitrophica bacterium]|nr:hypothetical protein [Candidatus Omnitrophota bacterium]
MRLNTNKSLLQGTKTERGQNRKNLLFWCLAIFISLSFLILLLSGAGPKSKPKVYIQKLKNGHYSLMVEGKPYIVKGVCYNPIPIGQGYDYDWWQDPYKPWLVDGKLMQEMGVNTVRIYQPSDNPEAVKRVIRDLYELYGIRTILGHWLGLWEYPCPFYADKDFQERIKKEVLQMVNYYKDEPGLLLWILGNENNYSCLGQVRPWSSDEIDKESDPHTQRFMRLKIYYSFVNELAKEIKRIDQYHPVALGNGELVGLEVASQFCPDIDLIACIIYRGKSFGNLFNSLKTIFDKPILLSEFGADSYDAYLKKEEQNMQAFFLESQWRQIWQNIAGQKTGTGNCIGGTIFEWSDEWWKHNEFDSKGWSIHDTESGWSNSSYYFDIKAKDNRNMNEEWFGIVALSQDEKEAGAGLDKRILRKAYYVIREFWRNPYKNLKIKNKKAK